MIDKAGKKECFVVSPIGMDDSDERHDADLVMKHVIRPAVEKFGYQAIRADQLGAPGDISDQVIEHLCDAPLVVANLTGDNPNVYYEMAVRHTLAKPLIPIAPKTVKLPFDIRGIRTVLVDIKDLDSVEDAKHQIENQIAAFEARPGEVPNPVTRVLSKKTKLRLERIQQILDG